MKCRIADFDVEFIGTYINFPESFEKYEIETEADIKITSTREDVLFEKNLAEGENYKKNLEITVWHRKFSEWLPLHDAFVLHSACFDVEGVGVAFAAHSGTGKTTHMGLWQKYLDDKMVVVNGDKPIVRFFDDEPNTPYAYGTPWNGKERLGCNMRTRLKHICFIERSETNFVEKITPSEAVEGIFNQVYMPKDPVAMAKTIELINRLISSCELWKIHCNMETEAAEVAYNAIFKK